MIKVLCVLALLLLSCGKEKAPLSGPAPTGSPETPTEPGETPSTQPEWERWEISSPQRALKISVAFEKKTQRFLIERYPTVLQTRGRLIPSLHGKDFDELCRGLETRISAIRDPAFPAVTRKRLQQEIATTTIGVRFDLVDFLGADRIFKEKIEEELRARHYSVDKVSLQNPLVLDSIRLGKLVLNEDSITATVRAGEMDAFESVLSQTFSYSLPHRNPNRQRDSLQVQLVDLFCDVFDGKASFELVMSGRAGEKAYEGRIVFEK